MAQILPEWYIYKNCPQSFLQQLQALSTAHKESNMYVSFVWSRKERDALSPIHPQAAAPGHKLETLRLHCNPNGLEKFDHLSTNDSGNDDRSKWAIEIIFSFYLNSR